MMALCGDGLGRGGGELLPAVANRFHINCAHVVCHIECPRECTSASETNQITRGFKRITWNLRHRLAWIRDAAS